MAKVQYRINEVILYTFDSIDCLVALVDKSADGKYVKIKILQKYTPIFMLPNRWVSIETLYRKTLARYGSLKKFLIFWKIVKTSSTREIEVNDGTKEPDPPPKAP